MRSVALILYATILTFTVVFAPHPSLGAENPLRVVVSGPYPPFAEIDEQGAVSGFDVDIAYALCKELQKECVVENIAFDEIIPALVAGKVDFAVAGMGVNEERKKLVDFTDRYYRSASIFIERKGDLHEITPETIKRKRIAAQTSSLQADYLAKTYGNSITLLTTASYEDIFALLGKGEVDVVLSDGLPGYAYLASEKGERFETIGSPLDPDDEVNWSRITLPKGQDNMRDALNQAIQNLRRSGDYDKINRKYFDFIIY